MAIKSTNRQEVETVTFFKRVWRMICQPWVQRFRKRVSHLRRKLVTKSHWSTPLPSSLAFYCFIITEEQNHSNGVHDMVFTFRVKDPHDSGQLKTCVVRGDKSDRRNVVGAFYFRTISQESGYCSVGGVTGTLPQLTHTTQSSAAQQTVEDKSGSLAENVDISEDIEGGGESFSLQSDKIRTKDYDSPSVNPPAPDDERSATSHNGPSDGKELFIAKDNTAISDSEKDVGVRVVDRYSSASALDKIVAVSDDKTDGPISCLKGRDEDSALCFPTPTSLGEADSQYIRFVNPNTTSGFSEATFPHPSHTPQHPSPLTQGPSPLHPHTQHYPARLQHSNIAEEVQSIAYTTNSFKMSAIATETAKEEPQHSRTTARVNPISTHSISSPKHGLVLPTTLSTRHQHLPEATEVHDGASPAVRSSAGKGAVIITTRAVPETAEGKDSLRLVTEPALLPAAMKAELIVPSSTRLRLGGFVDSASYVKRFTLSTKQESRPAHRIVIPEGKQSKVGCIVFSCIAAFEEGTFLPLPSREAVERSIGKGGNGTITIVYFKGVEFAVKRTHFRQMEVEILSSIHHDNVLPLQAVMMGEEDPQRPSRFLCYHFMPRMSGDLQSYLTKVGHGALSNLLMQHKEDPTMLQLVVDNTKHILRSTLKALAYLHSVGIVHNDVKPSNFLTTTQCSCVSPLTCDHGQRFAVKLSDFDSALDIAKVRSRHSVLRQFYRNNPTGTPGYRPPEYVLVATRTLEELDTDTLTAADVWAFGCSVLKIFLSHSGPHSQKQMAFLHLWHKGGCPWEREGEKAKEELKLGLLERVYPNWPHLWAFVGECLKVSPKDRTQCSKLLEHPFFAS